MSQDSANGLTTDRRRTTVPLEARHGRPRWVRHVYGTPIFVDPALARMSLAANDTRRWRSLTMSPRKPNKRSSIYCGKDGYWHGWVTVGVKSDGSPDRRHRGGRTEAEVTRRVRALEQQRDTGKAPRPGHAPTVEQWMTTYLDTICARLVATGKMAPRTLDDYRSKASRWIVPGLGKHRLDRLRPEHIDTLYAVMATAGKAESHILKVHRILSRALEIAVRRDVITRNVVKQVESPTA